MIVREVTLWQDVCKSTPSEPYFGSRFFSQRAKEKVPTFHAPTKPLEFGLIIGAEEWNNAEDYEESLASEPVYCLQIVNLYASY